MSAHDAREGLYRDLVAGLATGDALRERVAIVARAMGVPAESVLLDLYAEAWGVGYFER